MRAARALPLIVLACVLSISAAQAPPVPQPGAPSARRDFANLPGVRLWFTDTGGNGEAIVLCPAGGTGPHKGPSVDQARTPRS